MTKVGCAATGEAIEAAVEAAAHGSLPLIFTYRKHRIVRLDKSIVDADIILLL